MWGLRVSTDRADRVFGLSALTNSESIVEGHREVALFTLMLGTFWLHVHLYAEKDGRRRTPRSYCLDYEPGYGWTREWGVNARRREAQIVAWFRGE